MIRSLLFALAIAMLPGCATAPMRVRYAPPADPIACGRDLALAAVQLAAGVCRPPVETDAAKLACGLGTAAAALSVVSCHPVPVIVEAAP